MILGEAHGYWNRVSLRGSRTNVRSIWYGGEYLYPLTSLIKTIGGEFSDRQRNANHNYAYARLQQILSQDSSRTSVCTLCPVPGYDVGKVQNLDSLKLYDYLTLFQYPW